MTVTWLPPEGFDEISAATQLSTLTGWTPSATGVSIVAGRVAGSAVRMGASASLARSVPGNPSFLAVAFAIYYAPAGMANVLSINEGGTNHLQLRIDGAGGTVSLLRNGVLLATSTATLLVGWNHLEVVVQIGDAADARGAGYNGSYKVYLNGISTPILTASGVDTRNGGSGLVSVVTFPGTSGNVDIDDVLIGYDTVDPTTYAQMGDCRVITQLPTGDGANTSWTPSTGSSHSAMVDDANLGSLDTDYVKDATAGHYDTYTFPALGVTGTVKQVWTALFAKKDDTAARQVAPAVRRSGSNYDGTAVALTTSWAEIASGWFADPAGGSLSPTVVDAMEYGEKTVA